MSTDVLDEFTDEVGRTYRVVLSFVVEDPSEVNVVEVNSDVDYLATVSMVRWSHLGETEGEQGRFLEMLHTFIPHSIGFGK